MRLSPISWTREEASEKKKTKSSEEIKKEDCEGLASANEAGDPSFGVQECGLMFMDWEVLEVIYS